MSRNGETQTPKCVDATTKKVLRRNEELIFYMVRLEGFEPSRAFAHHPLKMACLPFHHNRMELLNGASGQNRTVDTRIFSPLLYRLSYRGIFCKKKVATPIRFELTIFAVTGRHVKPLHHEAAYNDTSSWLVTLWYYNIVRGL